MKAELGQVVLISTKRFPNYVALQNEVFWGWRGFGVEACRPTACT